MKIIGAIHVFLLPLPRLLQPRNRPSFRRGYIQYCDDSPRIKCRGFSGLLLKAPSEPDVRCNHTERLVGSRLSVSAGTQTVGTRMLLPEGTIYLGTPKHSSVVSMLENICSIPSYRRRHKWNTVLREAGGAASIPMSSPTINRGPTGRGSCAAT